MGERHVVLDTSCIVALVCGWHEHHSMTARAVEGCLAEGRVLALTAHSLVEAYAVLIRLPYPHRMSSADAFNLLDQNFRRDTQTTQLDALEVWTLLADARTRGVAGGQTYDALIAASARKLSSPLLLTWNLKHLAAFEDASLSVASPNSKIASANG